ncbi:hypothetical protein B296_00040462 [Ensete ventricosum]|uniref:Uncharacterized protein n=1 Tax=Ensete ventricosum TaxID=4639 RepID=A0A426ZKK2_ENSVE|nr:hypothetical protein B296_00040462 [Ensete ventricosum]
MAFGVVSISASTSRLPANVSSWRHRPGSRFSVGHRLLCFDSDHPDVGEFLSQLLPSLPGIVFLLIRSVTMMIEAAISIIGDDLLDYLIGSWAQFHAPMNCSILFHLRILLWIIRCFSSDVDFLVESSSYEANKAADGIWFPSAWRW